MTAPARATRIVRVVVVDDEPMVGEYLRTALATTGEVVVEAVGRDGAEAVELTVRHRPDVVLMDLRMPGVDGVRAIREVRALADPPAVVAITTLDTDEHVAAALEAGAAGFVLKATPAERLVPLVLAAAAGTAVLSPEVLQRLHQRTTGTTEHRDPRLDDLSDRETDVLALVADGLTNADIAHRLYLGEGTVKGVVSRLMVTLDCPNRTRLALLFSQGSGRG